MTIIDDESHSYNSAYFCKNSTITTFDIYIQVLDR